MQKLLIIDDEPEYLAELVEALAFNDIPAASVDSGAEALRALGRDRQIRLVLTDIRMPDMDGIAFVETAQRMFPERPLRFVVMTGHAAPVDIDRAHAAGVTRCFSKPLDFDELCHTLIGLATDRDTAREPRA